MTLLMRDKENIEKGFQQGMKEGLEQGLQKGLQQGIAEEKRRIAKSLLQMSILPEEKIADAAGISLEELREIKKLN